MGLRTFSAAQLFAPLLLLAGCQVSESSDTMADTADSQVARPQEAAELVWCPEVSRRLSRADCDDMTALAANAQRGVAAFNAPDPMTRDETVTLQLAVGFAPPPVGPVIGADNAMAELPPEDMNAEATAEEPGPSIPNPNRPVTSDNAGEPETPEEIVGRLPGRVESYRPVVGRYMRATLTGVGFEIKPQSPESQEVHLDDQTTWEWAVTARAGERHVLTLKTVVEGVTSDGRRFPLRTTTRNQTITVQVTMAGRIWDFLVGIPAWAAAIGAALVALTLLNWRTRRFIRSLFGRKPDANDPGEPAPKTE